MNIVSANSIKLDVIKSVLFKKEFIGIEWQRFTKMNSLLEGFRQSELTILSGKTGTGKTTFASEYSIDLAESGVRTLWGSFEINNNKLMHTLLSQYHRKSIKNLDETSLSKLIDEFHANIPIYFINSHGVQNIPDLLKTLKYARNEMLVDHIILDNLQFIVGVTGVSMMDKLHSQDKLVGRIREFVNDTGVHVTLIAHPKKESFSELLSINSLYGGCKLSQEADNIIILQSIETQQKKFIQILKNRHSGLLGSFPLNFNPETKSYTKPKSLSETVTSKTLLSKIDIKDAPPKIIRTSNSIGKDLSI